MEGEDINSYIVVIHLEHYLLGLFMIAEEGGSDEEMEF